MKARDNYFIDMPRYAIDFSQFLLYSQELYYEISPGRPIDLFTDLLLKT